MFRPNVGRALSAVGALIVFLALFMVWYHVDRGNLTESSTGWDTFTRLRYVILGAAIAVLATALPAQTRPVLVIRTLLGLLLCALILRRIIDPPGPPEVLDPVSAQIGVFFGLLGAVLVALGGLVDSGRKVIEHYPDLPLLRRPVGELGQSRTELGRGRSD